MRSNVVCLFSDSKLVTGTAVPLIRCDSHRYWKKHSYENSIKLPKSNLDMFTEITLTMKTYKHDFRNKQRDVAVKVYKKKDLMKNPDCNKKLRKFSKDFLLKNANLLNLCRPVTVDLIRERFCDLALETRDREESGERVMKKVNLPDIEEIRRINRSILTAQVAPNTADGASNVSIFVDAQFAGSKVFLT